VRSLPESPGNSEGKPAVFFPIPIINFFERLRGFDAERPSP
jgi:hypothetical protein